MKIDDPLVLKQAIPPAIFDTVFRKPISMAQR
jgi:hypothetical protein